MAMTEPLPAYHRTGALARRLERLLKYGCTDEQFLRDVAAHAALSSESSWEALAAVDQLYRRRKVSSQLFRAARIGIERRVLGVQESAGEAVSAASGGRATQGVAAPSRTPAPPPVPLALSDAEIVEQELQQLRADLERARSEATANLQRLEELNWPVPASTSTPSTPSTPVAAPMPTAGASTAPIAAPEREPDHVPEPAPAVVAARLPDRPPGQASVPVPDRNPASPPARRAAQRSAPSTRRARWPMILTIGGAALLLAWLLRMTLYASQDASASNAPVAAPAATAAAGETRADAVATAPPAEPAHGVVALSAERYVLEPDERMALIDLRRSEGSDGDLTVQWRVSAASAQHGRDFGGATRGQVILAAGVTQAQIAIPVLRNPGRQHTEFFDVRLTSVAGGARLGELQRATVFLMPVPRPVARRTH